METATTTAELAADCTCCRIDALDIMVRASDESIAKALKISEVARIARIEMRTRDMLLLKWRARAGEASSVAARVVANGGTLKKAFAEVDRSMNKWSSDVSNNYKQNLSDVYRLARIAGHSKATGKTKASLQYNVINFTEQLTEKAKGDKTARVKISFDTVDEAAIESIRHQELMWIGDVYSNVAPVVRAAVEPKMLAGLGREEAGALVKKAVEEKLKSIYVPDGWRGSDSKYFEGLAANAVTNARVQGQLTSFAKLGVTSYQIVNPMDDRTTPICQALNGQVFAVSDGVEQMGRLREAETPDEYKSVHPWIKAEAALAIMAKGGSSGLSKSGQSFPPYHFRCRSTVDVTTESATVDEIDSE